MGAIKHGDWNTWWAFNRCCPHGLRDRNLCRRNFASARLTTNRFPPRILPRASPHGLADHPLAQGHEKEAGIPFCGGLSGVNYFSLRVDSQFLLPTRTRCLMKMLPVEVRHGGKQNREATEHGHKTRIDRIDRCERYRSANRIEKKKSLDEFIEVTGFHRKHAIRALRRTCKGADAKLSSEPKHARKTPYNEAIVQALTILWETADRICGKRLKTILPALVESMERHGHLCLDSSVRVAVLEMSAATMDRVLKPVR